MISDELGGAKMRFTMDAASEPAGLNPLIETSSSPKATLRQKAKSRRAFLSGRVEMLGDDWLYEKTEWERRVRRNKSLGRRAIIIAHELSASVNRDLSKPCPGYAIRSHNFFVEQFGGTRNNVQDAITQLKNLAFIMVESSKREGNANRYQLWFPPVSFWSAEDDFPPF
ncbi:hypothetical protein R1A27_06440 [Methylobacterium sp. NMS12]|uniref:hypothetical protein n=1 Tax=Methylobacterium sp. NMS12 TaxID=3079766 RepID=UPI003F885EB0